MNTEILTNNSVVDKLTVHYKLSFKQLCLITLSIPMVALLICLVTGYIFQPNDIHETHCRVYNIIPSISAITGISPQNYLWRISIAFYIGPRFIISGVYRSYHMNLIGITAPIKDQTAAKFWLNLAYWIDLVELGSLCGVTYISNRENYPAHEKFFVVFMISSLTHMWVCIIAIRNVAKTRTDAAVVERGLKLKKNLLVISLLSTVGLIIFFLQHRLLCHRMAFSMFALCEYILAMAAIAYHVSVILEFPTEYLVIARGIKFTINDKLE